MRRLSPWCIGTSLLFAVTLCNVAVAQTDVTSRQDPSAKEIARAKRLMHRLDKNGNGKFERAENVTQWERFARLDVNQDQILSFSELVGERPGEFNPGGRQDLNVAYKQTPDGELSLDLYYPPEIRTKALSPVVVYTHGGGWAAGSKLGVSKGSFRNVFEALLNKGFAVASVDYRLCRPDKEITILDCVTDCKDAVRFLATNSQRFRLATDRFFVMGDSAGGQIAQMLLLTSPESLPGDEQLAAASYQIVAGVSWYGPCDFERNDLFNHDDRKDFRDRFRIRLLGTQTPPADNLSRYREVSPVNYLRENSPPLLMIQGDQDTTIPVKHAYYMRERAERVGAPVDVMIVQNAGHNWRNVDSEIKPSRVKIEQRTIQFFVEHLSKVDRRSVRQSVD